jgi:hypothetical protein
VDLTSLQGAATGLEGWVLFADTQLLGEVLREADLVLAVIKNKCVNIIKYCMI